MATLSIQGAEDLGKIIRDTRKRLHYTQKDLAGLSGTGERFIVELEKGKRSIELGKALHVARVLGLKLFAQVDEP